MSHVSLDKESSLPATTATVAALRLTGGFSSQVIWKAPCWFSEMERPFEDLVWTVLIVERDDGRDLVSDVVGEVVFEAGRKGVGQLDDKWETVVANVDA